VGVTDTVAAAEVVEAVEVVVEKKPKPAPKKTGKPSRKK
jgi:predicted secreted protein